MVQCGYFSASTDALITYSVSGLFQFHERCSSQSWCMRRLTLYSLIYTLVGFMGDIHDKMGQEESR